MNSISTLLRNGIPLYIQIKNHLKSEILSGEIEPGEQLPSEDDLAQLFGVSRMTIRQGVSELIRDGLVYRQHGKGTFVTQAQIIRDHTRLTDFFKSCVQNGLKPSAKVISRELIPASEKVAEYLLLEPGEQVILIETLRFINDKPITLHATQLPYKLVPQLWENDLDSLQLDRRHIWEAMEQYGVKVSRAQERLEALPADKRQAELLGMEEGSPILYGERVLYAVDGKPVKYADCYNRGDRFSLTISMIR
jgi:GntR family transcriptional regulator